MIEQTKAKTMPQSKQTPQEFIRDAFTPQIAVTCTPEAKRCCEKNNLDFTELLQPFSRLTNDATYKDPAGAATVIKNLKISFVDVKQKPPQTALARKLLNSSVSQTPEPKMITQEIKSYNLEIPSTVPWFESWRETFLKVQYPSDHEFIKNYLACFLVVSSTDSNPIEAMIQLGQDLSQMQVGLTLGEMPKWFSSNVLKFYVVLHDNVEGKIPIAHEAFESLKVSYGASNCFLLRMNSRPPGPSEKEHLPDPWSQYLIKKIDTSPNNYQETTESSPVTPRYAESLEIAQEMNESRSFNYHPLSPEVEDIMIDNDLEKEDNSQKKAKNAWGHGGCLSVEDIEQIKTMVYEFTRSCLMPYVEKQLAMLNDAVSNKKGMSKSLLSATKRWFSANKPSGIAANNLIYSADSPELHVRRLGDLYFMFGNYSLAFQAYHGAKRDYNADQAWLYYAGALEMAALSAFMANESSRKTYDYMEESITTYLNTCKMPQFATRATIFSAECLKSKQLYGEAAHQLIRMTSEDSDLRSALLLEQASYCFLLSNMLRKYAFHMVLAGHRFSKAGQKKHSFRCYNQAYQIYENTGWHLASDHIHYTIGRLANNLQKFDEAVESFAKLIVGESQQTAQQQATFLKEYLTILQNKLKKEQSQEAPVLPVPELNASSIKVLTGPTRPLSTPGKVPALGISFNSSEDLASETRWNKLEEMLVSEANGVPPLIFKPMITLYTVGSMEKNTPVAIMNEPIQVLVQIINSMQTVLLLQDIYLLWSYENETESVTNKVLEENVDKYIKTYVTKSVILQGNSKQDLVLSLTPLVTGRVKILGICYLLTGANSPTDSICVKGKKNIDISVDGSSNKPIEICVVPYAPCLQMTFSEMNLEFLAGELQRVLVDLHNTGSVPLKNVYLATSVPHLISYCELKQANSEYTAWDAETPQIREKLARKNHITSIPLPNDRLDSGQSISFYIWVKAPSTKGSSTIDLLMYYENVDSKSVPKYRLIRHSWNILVQESISVDVSPKTSYNSKTEEELALALKTTNLNKIHNSISTEITLLNVALLSKNWQLTKDIVTPKYISLNSQESAHILLKAKRRVHKESQHSSIPLNSERVSIPHLRTAFLTFAKAENKPLLNAFESASEAKENKDGILILEWKALVCEAANRRLVKGHTCIPIEVNRREQIQLDRLISDTIIDINSSMEATDKSSETAQNQVTYNVLHPAVVRHNFKKVRSCTVPITLVLHSVIEEVVSVTINTVDPSTKPTNKQSKTNLFIPQATNSFCWLTTGKITRTLNPLTSMTVQLSVIVTNPGIFDLGSNLGVFCNRLDKDELPVLQLCEIYSALIVVDIDS